MKSKEEWEEEIDLKAIAATLWRYRRSILVTILLVTLLAGIKAYFTPSVYRADSLVKLAPKVRQYGGILKEEVFPEINDNGIEDEMAVFKSRTLARKVLEELNLGTRYFITRRMREIELYKSSPFIVQTASLTPELYGKRFILEPEGAKRFKLKIEPSLHERIVRLFSPATLETASNGESFPGTFEGLYRYGEAIKTPWFELKIIRRSARIPEGHYSFSVVPNRVMAGFIQSGISVNRNSKAGHTLRVSFRDTVPQRAQEILQKVIDAYVNSDLNYRKLSAEKRLAFIEKQIRAVNRSLKKSAEKLEAYKSRHSLVNLDEKVTETARKVSKLESERFQVMMQSDLIRKLLDRIRRQKNLKKESIDYPIDAGTTIDTLVEELRDALSRYEVMSVRFTPNHPERKAMEKKIATLRASLNSALKNALVSLNEKQKLLEKAIKTQQSKIQSLPEEEKELGYLTRIFMVNQKIYSFLLEKRAEISIEKSAITPTTRILDPASYPGAPIKPRRSLILLVGLILGVILGVAQALLRDFFDNRIHTAEELTRLTSLPLYGVLPQISDKKTTAFYRESLRALWVNLSFFKTDKAHKIISITSTLPGEGKTFTLANLAKVMARGGEKSIVLVDLDMRRARLHKIFNVSNRSGMSTVLSGHATLEEVIRPTEDARLHLIPAGPITDNPTGLIMSNVLEPLLRSLSEKYDYVFIDTPPMGLVADPLKIMNLSDLVLYVVRADLTTRSFIEKLDTLQEREKAEIGIIFNGVRLEKVYGYDYRADYLNNYLSHRRLAG